MNMLEKMARAIDPAAFDGRYPESYAPTNIIARNLVRAGERRRKKAFKQARFALAALREPTEGMLAAATEADFKQPAVTEARGIDEVSGCRVYLQCADGPTHWRAMLAAAEGGE